MNRLAALLGHALEHIEHAHALRGADPELLLDLLWRARAAIDCAMQLARLEISADHHEKKPAPAAGAGMDDLRHEVYIASRGSG